MNTFNKEIWTTIFPYINCSSVFTHDNRPFWTYPDFLAAVDYCKTHKKQELRGFCSEGNTLTNKLELASFLANFQQETGDPSIKAPYPWTYPKVLPRGIPGEGNAGGGLGLIEGVSAAISFETTPPRGEIVKKVKLNIKEKQIIGTKNDQIYSYIQSLGSLNQPGFGLPGSVIREHYRAVADDGTIVSKFSDNLTGRSATCGGLYCQYSGRGAIQLSYNYNYTDCSLDLFGDYRLVAYPNLITTTDRKGFNGNPKYFGFPGPNPGGDNQLPVAVAKTTPDARQLAWITAIWFWMTKRSGRQISCHYSMKNWQKFGITSCNSIINNQSGCEPGWAGNKIEYYKRICNILGIPENKVKESIVCPANPQSGRKI